MKPFLVTLLVSLLTVSALAQSPATAVNLKVSATQNDETLKVNAERIRQIVSAMQHYAAVTKVVDKLPIVADRYELDDTGTIVHAIGNVTIRTNDVVIKADDAVIENGEIRLGANPHVVFEYPGKMNTRN